MHDAPVRLGSNSPLSRVVALYDVVITAWIRPGAGQWLRVRGACVTVGMLWKACYLLDFQRIVSWFTKLVTEDSKGIIRARRAHDACPL